MSEANYMEVMPGGHCLTCHKDYEDDKYHPCFTTGFIAATPCTKKTCGGSKFQMTRKVTYEMDGLPGTDVIFPVKLGRNMIVPNGIGIRRVILEVDDYD